VGNEHSNNTLCVLLKRVPQGRTESAGIVLAANAGPRVPSGGVTLKRRCTYRPSVIYLIVNKLLSLSLSPLGLVSHCTGTLRGKEFTVRIQSVFSVYSLGFM